MTDPTDPPRLVDDPNVAPHLRDVLEASRRDVASQEQVSTLRSALAPLIWPTVGAGVVGGTAAVATKATGAQLIGGAVVAAALAGGGAWATFGDDAGSEPPAAAIPAAQRAPLPSDATEAPAADPARNERRVAAQVEPEPKPAAAPAPRKDKLPLKRARSEAQLLEAARAAVKANPRHALQLTREHARRFPAGMLVQEREVLAIEALDRLGKEEEAATRANRFGKSHPDSAHRSKVKAVVDDH